MQDTGGPEMTWQLISNNEEKNGGPTPRTYFTMVPKDDNLWFFGGFGDSKGRYNDLRYYNAASASWTNVNNQGVFPKPIYLHSAAVDGDHMYVFGGSSGKDTNDFYDYNFTTHVWTMMAKSESCYPGPRYGHASIVCSGRLLIVGGCKHTMVYFQDTYCYNLSTKVWVKFGDLPLDMAYHSLVSYNNRVYLFGGYNGTKFGEALYVLDWDKGLWVKVPTKGTEPTPRCGCAAQVFGDSLWIFGGYTAKGHNNDLFRLDFPSMTWHTIPAKNRPSSRAYLQSSVVGGHMYVFGGYDGSTCVTDFRRLPLTGTEPDVDVMKFLTDQKDPKAQVDYVMRHFCKGAPEGKQTLDSEAVGALLAHITARLPASVPRPRAESPDTRPEPNLAKDPDADLPAVHEAVYMGFSKEQAVAGIKMMRAQGKDISNANLLVNMLFDHPNLVAEQAPPPPPKLEPQTSQGKNSKLLAQMEADLQQCKICFQRKMDCAMVPCGHLIGCKQCAKDAADRKLGCLLCRRPVTNTFPIFWN